MNINRKNYEVYFTDYLDGHLNPEEIKELQNFLLIHSDLAELLEDTGSVKLNPPRIIYPGKQLLQKDILHECPDYYAIAIAENSLDPEDEKLLNRHPQKQQIQANAYIYQNLKFKPDTEIRFTQKKRLYRKNTKHYTNSILAIAAIFLLSLAFGFWLYRQSEEPKPTSLALSIPAPAEVNPIPLPIQTIPIPEQKTFVLPEPKPDRIPTPPKIHLTPAEIIPQPLSAVYSRQTDELQEKKITISFIEMPEIMLTENAGVWKPSENKILSDNIFTSMINAGKLIAEKIKTNF